MDAIQDYFKGTASEVECKKCYPDRAQKTWKVKKYTEPSVKSILCLPMTVEMFTNDSRNPNQKANKKDTGIPKILPMEQLNPLGHEGNLL